MIYRFNEFELDTRSFQLSRSGTPVAVEPQVLELLKYLVVNRGRLISREELFEEIWSGRIVSDSSLSNHIKSARKAIGDNGHEQLCIKTVHGRGYQFTASITEVVNQGSDLASMVRSSAGKRPESEGPFVVVLPFQNMSSDAEQEYFAKGMSEDITTELSRFSDIQVIARHTAFQFDSASLDVRKLCDDLGVDYLVEGSVRRTRDRVRINVQLIDAEHGKHIWAEKFDRPIDEVFEIQDEITATIVSTISGQIRRIETDRATRRGTSNLRAYDHFLRGIDCHKNGYVSFDNYVRANEEFTRAIELDPVFPRARAWAVCATASMWASRNEQSIKEAIDAAKYALSLDVTESETHRVLGSLYLYIRDYQLSGYHFNEAKRLSPNDAHIAVKMGRYYAYIDQNEEALNTISRSMRLNPLHPGWYWQELGVVQYSMGEFEKSIATYQKNWELGAYDLALIAASQVALGDMGNARETARKALEIEPRASVDMYTRFETYRDEPRHLLLRDRMIAAGLPE